jgi:hypothetical protein
MSEFAKKSTNLYVKDQEKPWKISRAKIELFMGCRRCFYFDRKLGISRPPGFPFSLNSCVDSLLKTEFDTYRETSERHPIMPEGLVPFMHPQIDVWRANFKGVQYHDPKTNFLITGAVDDIWVDNHGIIAVVDYKSTSKAGRIEALDQAWQDGYKRQMEIYQWLLRKIGMSVASTGYFVYANGNSQMSAFDNKIEFDLTLIPYVGDDNWVQGMLEEIKKVLDSDNLPESDGECDYCNYVAKCQNI